jgi:hypothetical protein
LHGVCTSSACHHQKCTSRVSHVCIRAPCRNHFRPHIGCRPSKNFPLRKSLPSAHDVDHSWSRSMPRTGSKPYSGKHALATEVAKLKELICKRPPGERTSETMKPYHSLNNVTQTGSAQKRQEKKSIQRANQAPAVHYANGVGQ